MEESLGSQYALQVALQTLKERCQQFQQRLTVLEEENLQLRLQCSKNDTESNNSLSAIDQYKERVTELTEQNAQLTNRATMVATENRQLWSRLSKLMKVNKTLGSHLTKINEKLSSKLMDVTHSPIVRSKTFTQEEPYTKFLKQQIMEENHKISIELEDISLKLASDIAKEKLEATDGMDEGSVSTTFGFAYFNEDDDSISEEIQTYLNSLKDIKTAVSVEHEKLKKNIENVTKVDYSCKTCEEQKKLNELKNSRIKEADSSPADSNSSHETKESEKPPTQPTTQLEEVFRICPICSKKFPDNIEFTAFQIHVEDHFIIDDPENFELLT